MSDKPLFKRFNVSLVAGSERRLLIAIASRLPDAVTPDRLTGFGVFGAVIVLLGYIASAWNVAFLWIANLGLLIHWFGDSLDGTVARYRNIERPRYGFFLDQTIDTVGNLLIALGVGLSPWARLDTALLVLALYHMLTIYVFARNIVDREFHLALSGLGPTELRLGILGMNLAILMFGAEVHHIGGRSFTWCDAVMLLTTVGLFVLFVAEVARHLRHLVHEDTAPSGNNA